MNYTRYIELRNLLDGMGQSLRHPILQIVIGAHSKDTWVIPDSFVLYNTENSWNKYMDKQAVYFQFLKRSQGVMLYAPEHVHHLRDALNDTSIPVEVVPLFSEPLYYRWKADSKNLNLYEIRVPSTVAEFESARPIEVHVPKLFAVSQIGVPTLRRMQFLESLLMSNLSPLWRGELILSNFHVDTEKLGNLSVPLDEDLLRLLDMVDLGDVYTRETMSIISKVAINIHQSDEPTALETHRIHNLLALGVPVISERGTKSCDELDTECWHEDDDLDSSGAVRFEDAWNQVLNAVDELSRECEECGDKRQTLSLRGHKHFQDRVSKNVTSLERFMMKVFVRLELHR